MKARAQWFSCNFEKPGHPITMASDICTYKSEQKLWYDAGGVADSADWDLMLVEFPLGILTSYVLKGDRAPYRWSCLQDGVNSHNLAFDESQPTRTAAGASY